MSGTSTAVPHVAGVAALWGESLLASTRRIDFGLLQSRLTGTGQELPGVAVTDAGAGLGRAPQQSRVRHVGGSGRAMRASFDGHPRALTRAVL